MSFSEILGWIVLVVTSTVLAIAIVEAVFWPPRGYRRKR